MDDDMREQTMCMVAATLAAALRPKDHEDAVTKYESVLIEIRKRGLLTDSEDYADATDDSGD